MAQSAAKMFIDAEATLRTAGEKGADGELVDSAIAEVRLSAGKTAEAEAMLRQVLRRVPELVGPIMNLAIVRAKEGNTAEAVALIRLAWHLGYQNPKELRTTPEFARIRELGLLNDLVSVAVGRCAIY
jgi:predicted Zn-dependent protease